MGFSAGNVRCCTFDFAPQGWLPCDGRKVAVKDYPELFTAIGNTFGGDGSFNFNLPDLQSRSPVHAGQDAEGAHYTRGQTGGALTVTLNLNQLPAHGHTSPATTNVGVSVTPEAGAYAANEAGMYNPVATGNSGPILAPWGGSEAHNNLMPFSTVNYIIAISNGAEIEPMSASDGSQSHGTMPQVSGQVAWFASEALPPGWLPCDGQSEQGQDGQSEQGQDGLREPYIPDLRGRFCLGAGGAYGLGQLGGESMHTLNTAEMPEHFHTIEASGGPPNAATPIDNFPAAYAGMQGPLYGKNIDTWLGTSNFVGQGLPHENMPPFLVLVAGTTSAPAVPSEPFLGEIRLLATEAIPEGWERCEGQTKSIAHNPALYALLGTKFGGDGKEFALPDLRGRIAQGQGEGAMVGDTGGETTVTLATAQMPAHGHSRRVSTNTFSSQDAPAPDTYVTQSGGRGGFLQLYATPGQQAANSISMLPSAPTGGEQSHNNMAPFIALNACICLAGLFPPRP